VQLALCRCELLDERRAVALALGEPPKGMPHAIDHGIASRQLKRVVS
jgi:hypothetical protein